MHKYRRYFIPLILFLFVLILIAIPVWVSYTTASQQQLNADLIIALRLGQVEDAQSLLEQGADPNAHDLPDIQPGSHLEQGTHSKARDLLDIKPGIMWQQILGLITLRQPLEVEQFRTALSWATDSKHATELVKLLLDRGASIKIDEKCGQPALSEAVLRGDIATVRLLLDHGANINTTDEGGEPALVQAAGNRDLATVKMLISRGAALNARDSEGHTALWQAACSGRPDIVRWLVGLGANVNARDQNGKTILTSIQFYLSIGNGRVDPAVAAILKRAGATK